MSFVTYTPTRLLFIGIAKSWSRILAEYVTHTEVTIKAQNSVALVRERTIPTKRPKLVGEVSDNFCG
jgi:hypothetical protein